MPNPDQPQWDVALEALLADTQRTTGSPLNMAQLHRLAEAYNIRLDDLLDTLCRLVEHKAWSYLGADGKAAPLDRHIVRLLHANHRLNEVQLARLDGSWQPAG